MCLGGGGARKSADEYYQEMRVEPDPLPELPTGGEVIERRQRRGLKNAKTRGQTQRTILNLSGGDSNV